MNMPVQVEWMKYCFVPHNEIADFIRKSSRILMAYLSHFVVYLKIQIDEVNICLLLTVACYDHVVV